MKKSSTTRYAIAAVAAAMILPLAACGGSGASADGVTELSVWSGFTENDGKVVQKIADEFNKSQKKVKVTIEQNPWNVINDKMLSAISAGNGPDVVTYQPDGAKGYIQQGAFVSRCHVWTRQGVVHKCYSAVLHKNEFHYPCRWFVCGNTISNREIQRAI